MDFKSPILTLMVPMYNSKEANIRNWYNQVPHLTQDTIWESDKNTRKNHTQEGQEVSLFPAGDHQGCKEQTRQ